MLNEFNVLDPAARDHKPHFEYGAGGGTNDNIRATKDAIRQAEDATMGPAGDTISSL